MTIIRVSVGPAAVDDALAMVRAEQVPIVLSDDQQVAVDAVASWWEQGSSQELRVGGLAGTGKTTIAAVLPRMLGLDTAGVAYCAYTNKAALVLGRKLTAAGTHHPATTIHRLVYKPVERHCFACPANRESGTCHRSRRSDCGCKLQFSKVAMLPPKLRLIIVDEASTVNAEAHADLLSYGRRIVWIGDHGQLPPVVGSLNLMEDPDVLLERIHRQADGSSVLQLAMAVRELAFWETESYGPGVTIGGELEIDVDADWQEQLVLCHRNDTRTGLNAAIREARGFPADRPVVGDRVISLSNNHDAGIVNGSLGTVTAVAGGPRSYRLTVAVDGRRESYEGVVAGAQFNHPSRLIERNIDLWDYGYCITVHKAQGSEVDRVYVVDEYPAWDKDRRRWLYTAVTRARREVVVVDG